MTTEQEDFDVEQWCNGTKELLDKNAAYNAEKMRTWNPENEYLYTLKGYLRELKRSIEELLDFDLHKKIEDYIDMTSLGVAEKYKDRVSVLSSYPIWACDFNGVCLVGDTADDWEHIDTIEINMRRSEEE